MRATQQQLILPILEELEARGGTAKPAEIYDGVAQRAGIDEAARAATVTSETGHTWNRFTRDVRWARQKAVMRGLIDATHAGVWSLTGKGRDGLRNIAFGKLLTVFETELGIAIAANCEDAAAIIEPGSVQLVFTSPPYAQIAK